MPSCARWVEEIGGPYVAAHSHRCSSILQAVLEEIGFLAEIGAFIPLSDKDETIGIEDIYEKLVGGKYGRTWDTFQAYKHFKSFGYNVGRGELHNLLKREVKKQLN